MGHILKRKNVRKYPVTHIILEISRIACQVYSTNNSCLVIKHASFETKVYYILQARSPNIYHHVLAWPRPHLREPGYPQPAN